MVDAPKHPCFGDLVPGWTAAEPLPLPSARRTPATHDHVDARSWTLNDDGLKLLPSFSYLASSYTRRRTTLVTPMTVPPPPRSPNKRPRKRARMDHGDRFRLAVEESQRVFQQTDEPPPSMMRTRKVIPHESDAAREQANATFSKLLYSEISEQPRENPSPPFTPIRPGSVALAVPSRKKVLSTCLPSKLRTPRNPGQDDPSRIDTLVRKETKDYLRCPQKALRVVRNTPYMVLTAPDLIDDLYLNLVDWSSTDILGIGIGPRVCLRNMKTAEVTTLCDLGQHDHITSLNWVNEGSHLAVGTSQGHIQIWDATSCKRLRDYTNAHSGRVGALAWYQGTITSGSRDRGVQHRDVRAPDKRAYEEHTLHKQEVCGLKWNVQLGQLASGGNDKLLVWDHRSSRRKEPLWKFHEHSAAVKAIAWSPHNPGVLVSGGGTQDKKMRFWNTQMGTLLDEVDTGSQVCNLVWSKNSQEFVSTHGYSSTSGQNQICIWAYPRMDMVARLSGHTNRVLYLAMSPGGHTIATGAGDETVRLWNVFPHAQEKRGGKTISAEMEFNKGDAVVR